MMFLLGAKDRRVPMQDGLQYIAALRAVQQQAKSGTTPPNGGGATSSAVSAESEDPSGQLRVLSFPEDTHALDKPQTEFEQWLNVAWWLSKHGVA